MFVACEQVVCYRCQLQVCLLPVLLTADCRLSAAAGDADLPSAAELQQLLRVELLRPGICLHGAAEQQEAVASKANK